MNILKIGNRYLNMDQVVEYAFGGDVGVLTVLTVDWENVNGEQVGIKSDIIKLQGIEAMAVKWWFDSHSQDAVKSYQNALFSMREGV